MQSVKNESWKRKRKLKDKLTLQIYGGKGRYVSSLFGHHLLFKSVNNVVESNFNENFAKKSTCGSREQCTGPTNFDANATEVSIWMQRPHLHPAFHIFFFLRRAFHVFSVRSVHCLRDPQTSFFHKTFIKNYFTIVFSIFNGIQTDPKKKNSIQTHASYIPSINYLKEKKKKKATNQR